MKAIVTKYHGPSNTRKARITATEPDGQRLTMPIGKAEDIAKHASMQDVHQVVADALREKLGWNGTLVGGALKDGYAFVFEPTRKSERHENENGLTCEEWCAAAQYDREPRLSVEERVRAWCNGEDPTEYAAR